MSHQIKFEQLLDLAFGEPENQGLLNIRCLHAFLHALLSQVKLGSVRVELKGDQFSHFDELVECLKEKPHFHVTEYEAQKNEHSGRYDKKQQIKATPTHVDKLVMVRETREQCSSSKVEKTTNHLMVDERMNIVVQGHDQGHVKSKTSKAKICSSKSKEKERPTIDLQKLEQRVQSIEEGLSQLCSDLRQCQERSIQQEGSTRPATGESSGKQSIQSSSLYSSSNADECPPASPTNCDTATKRKGPDICIDDIDMGAVFQCLVGMNRELEDLKRESCKTQKILNGLCEKSRLMATVEEDTDLKICEMQTVLDDHLKRIEKLFIEICTCKKAVEENTNRIDIAFEEQETLFRIKADKDEVLALLDEKANRDEVEKKLDRDVFERERREIHDKIAHIHKEMNSLAQQLEDEVKKLNTCLETKLDKEFFKAFATCTDNRIKDIAHETKRWINVKKKEVCAFTRTPFEQNLCCGVCSNPVVMRGQECSVPKLSPMMNLAWNSSSQGSKCCRTGGPHTITTPRSRVCRTGKFESVPETARMYASATDCRSDRVDLNFEGTCYQNLCEQKEQFNVDEHCNETSNNHE